MKNSEAHNPTSNRRLKTVVRKAFGYGKPVPFPPQLPFLIA
jgi:hypothetical protein